MELAPIPPNEKERLAAVLELKIYGAGYSHFKRFGYSCGR